MTLGAQPAAQDPLFVRAFEEQLARRRAEEESDDRMPRMSWLLQDMAPGRTWPGGIDAVDVSPSSCVLSNSGSAVFLGGGTQTQGPATTAPTALMAPAQS